MHGRDMNSGLIRIRRGFPSIKMLKSMHVHQRWCMQSFNRIRCETIRLKKKKFFFKKGKKNLTISLDIQNHHFKMFKSMHVHQRWSMQSFNRIRCETINIKKKKFFFKKRKKKFNYFVRHPKSSL
jgi:hypothetical protein